MGGEHTRNWGAAEVLGINLGINNAQFAAVLGRIVGEQHGPAVVFGGVRAAGHKECFTARDGRHVVHLSIAGGQVIFVDLGTHLGIVGVVAELHRVAVAGGQTKKAVINTSEVGLAGVDLNF